MTLFSRTARSAPSTRPKNGNTAGEPITRNPGPFEEAAAKQYFERGSREAIEASRWRVGALIAGVAAAMEGAALMALLPLKSVETVALGKDQNNRMQVVGVAGQVSVDDEVKMAWCSDWVSLLTEITPVTWERNVNSAAKKTVGVATDQVASYLRRKTNNPALLLRESPNYVREYERDTVNKVTQDVFLVRYRLTSRPRPGVTPEVRAYAMTITVASVKPSTREDIFRNPSGLVATNFSLAEES
jgi:type IV secretory pathway component VirB8